MQRIYLQFVVCLAIALLAGCTARPMEKPVEIDLGQPGDRLFLMAEQLLNQKKADEALAAYGDYLTQFPRGRHADNALRRMGSVYQQKGQLDTALDIYQRLVNEFESSPYLDEVRLAVIGLLSRQDRTAEALDQALRMEASQLAEPIRLQVWQHLVELHTAAGNRADAIRFEYRLFQSTSGEQKAQWADRVKQVIPDLTGAEIEQLWDEIVEEPFRGDLLYRYAMTQVMAENFDDASAILATFLKAYPQHPEVAKARDLAQALLERLEFEPLTVGCLLPLSGSYALYGQRALNGIELALNAVQSGPAPLAIKLLIKDTGSEDSRAVQGVRELVEARAGIILGPMVTAAAAAQEAQRLQIPMITFTQKADITIGDYVFRHFITPHSQVQTLVNYFVNTVGLRNFAILHPNDPYGKTFREIFWNEVIRQGGRVVAVESYDGDETDFTLTLNKLKGTSHPVPPDLAVPPSISASRNPNQPPGADTPPPFSDPLTRLGGLYHQTPAQARSKASSSGRSGKDESEVTVDFEVLFIPDAPKKAGLIIPQVPYNSIEGIYLAGTNLWHSSQLIEMSGDYLKGAVLVDGFFTEGRSETVQHFVQLYRDTYRADPGTVEAYAFDSARLVFALAANPDIRMRHDLRDLLLQSSLSDGVTGPLSFDQNGEAIKHLFLLGVKGNQFIEIPRR